MPADARTIVTRWFEEVWNQGNEKTVDELFAANGIGHGLGEEAPVEGPEGFKIFLRNMRSAFPDVNIQIEDLVTGDEKAVARIRFTGTHLGDGLGLPRSERRVTIQGMVMVRIANGQIVEGWNNWDQLGLLRQIGAPAEKQRSDRFLTARPSTWGD